MKGHERLEQALIKAANDVGYKTVYKGTSFEVQLPTGEAIFIIQPPISRNKRGIYSIKSVADFRYHWEILFAKRTVEKEIAKWTKYVRNFPKRMKRLEMNNKLNDLNEDF
jgi:hypothetical protein